MEWSEGGARAPGSKSMSPPELWKNRGGTFGSLAVLGISANAETARTRWLCDAGFRRLCSFGFTPQNHPKALAAIVKLFCQSQNAHSGLDS
jgi:hypothetical protein